MPPSDGSAKGDHLQRAARFVLFLERLDKAAEAASDREAFELLANTLNAVEDEHSGVPYLPDSYMEDGRMYPPREDSLRRVPGRTDLVRYRTKGHNVFIGVNGAIRIEDVSAERKCWLSKVGANGKPVVL